MSDDTSPPPAPGSPLPPITVDEVPAVLLQAQPDDKELNAMRLQSAQGNRELLALPAYSPVATASADVHRVFKYEALLKAVDDAQLQHGYPICAHLSLAGEKKLVICTRRAGINTNHDGVGRCSHHDPVTAAIQPSSPYARYLGHFPTLQDLFADIDASRPQFQELGQELTMARTVLARMLQQLGVGQSRMKMDDTLGKILQCLELIRRLAESTAKIKSIGNQQLTLDSVTAFLWLVNRIIEEEVSDASVRLRVMDRIATEARFPV